MVFLHELGEAFARCSAMALAANAGDGGADEEPWKLEEKVMEMEDEQVQRVVIRRSGYCVGIDEVVEASCVVLPCGHGFIYRPGDKIYLEQVILCGIPVVKEYPCGHRMILKCFELSAYKDELNECPLPCHSPLTCGHPCPAPDKCHFVIDPNHVLPKFLCNMACKKTICLRGAHKNTCTGSHPCIEPCPPCKEVIWHELECGHAIKRFCYEPSPNEDGYICQFKCRRPRSNCLHPCEKRCDEDCGKCYRFSARECANGHLILRECWRKDLPLSEEEECKELVKVKTGCGHSLLMLPCNEAVSLSKVEAKLRCPEPCTEILKPIDSCGHPCSGSCGECFQYRFHKSCQNPCGRQLVCNHVCTSPCGAGCPPCENLCIRSCVHKRCEKKCGVPCEWECKEACVYSCEHGSCSKACDEVCDKEPCKEPCSSTLPCGHPCVGFCGEPCPPYCFQCDKEKLTAGKIFGDEVEEMDKFIYLEECGHAIESSVMDQWMENEPDDNEILPFRCPLCRTRLGWMHRYSKKMERNWDRVESAKKHVFGEKEKIKDFLDRARAILEETKSEEGWSTEVVFCPKLLNRMENLLDGDECSGFSESMASFLAWMAFFWSRASQKAGKFLKVKARKVVQCREDFENLESRWNELFQFVATREWPFQRVEMATFTMEMDRLQDLTSLFSVIVRCHDKNKEYFQGVYSSELGQRRLREALSSVKDPMEYNENAQKHFQENYKIYQSHMKVTLALSKEERLDILKAFHNKTGRFFKCPNGHTYIITECGGAMEEGKCPECGAIIGGRRHALTTGNFLAQEMDGAKETHYDALVRRDHELAVAENIRLNN